MKATITIRRQFIAFLALVGGTVACKKKDTIAFTDPCTGTLVNGQLVTEIQLTSASPVVMFQKRLYALNGSEASPIGWVCANLTMEQRESVAKGFQVLTAPVDIPDVIPEIDLSEKLTNEADFSGRGVAGGVASGVEGGSVPVNQDQPFSDFQVEKPVAPFPGSGSPRYPEILLSAGVEGQVLGQFVVDTLGRVESGSFKVIRSDHDLFSAAVEEAVPAMRFFPAEVGGRKVKQLVQQPFIFNRYR